MINSRIFRPARRLCLALAATVFVAILAPALAANLSASLSVEEQQFAGSQANKHAWIQSRSGSHAGPHSLGVQTLSIELDERKNNNNQRRARVYQFNYNTQQSRLILVDLVSRNTIKAQRINSIHLPLNEHEIATARALVEQQPDIMKAMNVEREARGLPPIADLSSIDVKASIYEPLDASQSCAKQRCALISMFDRTRTVFTVEPVVNLQQLSVTTLQQSL